MKRFHVHLAVDDLPANIDFYSKLFGAAPSKQRDDYAKWMLDDPRVNFAISQRGHSSGVNHFGFQVETESELEMIRVLAEAAAGDKVIDQGEAQCCYARSNKHWTIDPQGIAWEHYQTLDDVPQYGEDTQVDTGACCVPGQETSNTCCN